ncbi:MAG: threonine synthase [Thermoprotei archaeon]|jgi:threonine synthase
MSFKLRCRECGTIYEPEARFVCEKCLGPLEVVYDFKEIKFSINDLKNRRKNMWRYKEFLPVKTIPEQFTDIGFTPLYKPSRLNQLIGLKEFYIKNDTLNPTGSFKDRPASVAIIKSLEFNFKAIGTSSTGNLAAAVAALSSRVGLPSFVLVPSDTELSKIVQAIAYGANVLLVDGNYDELNFLTLQLAENGLYGLANVNLRPYYAEGSKILAYEIAEQLNWSLPDKIIIPMASGALLYMIWKGLNELISLDLVDNKKVSLIGVQPQNCSPIVSAYKTGQVSISNCKTIAKSLAIGNPADGRYAIKAIKESRGLAIDVTDEEIVNAMKILAKYEGLFAEPAGAITTAALIKLVNNNVIKSDEQIVCLMTGSGFKSLEIFEQEAIKLKANPIKANLQVIESKIATW